MRNRLIRRCGVLMASAASLLLLGLAGCAGGGADDGVNGVTDPNAAAADAALDRGVGATEDASADASGNEGDATGSGRDAQNTTDVESVPEGAAGDGNAANEAGSSDAGVDASFPPDGSTRDEGGAVDASIDAPADVVDSGVPIDASCTTTCGAQALCITGTCIPSRRVFVSTERFTGNLGGTSGADGTCQSLANSAHLGGIWKAWISDNTTSPSTRFAHATVGYRLLDGTLLANDWTGLVSGSLLHGIDLTDQRGTVDNSEVWTGTLESGVAIGTDVCGGFTSSANGANHSVIGNTSRTDIGWSNATSQSCDQNTLRIYCMEQ
jgi:hypothetical protein